jgi:predicted ATP-grasp superfamily ATP-dependent carboligase
MVLDAISKGHVNRLAAEAGLTVPGTVELTPGSLPPAHALTMPAVVKPVRSELDSRDGGLVRGHVERIDTPEKLRETALRAAGRRCLVQPVIEGRLGAVCGVAWNGEVVLAVHQRSKRIWPPEAGVSAYAETVPPDLELDRLVARLVGLLGWSGIFQMQFIEAEDGAYFIDLNPRIYGSLALAVAAGANLPAIWVALIAGSEPAVPGRYRCGVHYRCEELDARALLRVLRTEGPLAAAAGLVPHRHTTHAIACLEDPLPALTSLGKLSRRILRPARARPRAATGGWGTPQVPA